MTEIDWSKYQDFEEDFGDIEDRDCASLLLPHLDYDYQLLAIHALLKSNRNALHNLSTEIDHIDAFARKATGLTNEHAVEEWLDHLQQFAYQKATHSMAAVGMIAPLLGIFAQRPEYAVHRIFGALCKNTHLAEEAFEVKQRTKRRVGVSRWSAVRVWITTLI